MNDIRVSHHVINRLRFAALRRLDKLAEVSVEMAPIELATRVVARLAARYNKTATNYASALYFTALLRWIAP